ncbi:MAG: hypothetical protein JRI68_06610 [Deltaproteobacteria bacterium]|nr:hypothetical protein [Deltaproteobacteria bacterium]
MTMLKHSDGPSRATRSAETEVRPAGRGWCRPVWPSAVLVVLLFLGACHHGWVFTIAPAQCEEQRRPFIYCMSLAQCTSSQECTAACPAEAEALRTCEDQAVRATAAASASEPSAATKSCARDLDCSGDLICQAGSCVPPK